MLAGSPQLISFNLNKTTLVRNGNDSISATVTISCPPGYNGYEWGPTLSSANGYVLIPSGVILYCGTDPTATSGPFGISPYVFGGTSPVSDTITATVPYGNSLSQTVTINPLVPTLTISPGTLRDGLGQTLTATLSTGGVQVYNGAGDYNFSANAGGLAFSGVSIPHRGLAHGERSHAVLSGCEIDSRIEDAGAGAVVSVNRIAGLARRQPTANFAYDEGSVALGS